MNNEQTITVKAPTMTDKVEPIDPADVLLIDYSKNDVTKSDLDAFIELKRDEGRAACLMYVNGCEWPERIYTFETFGWVFEWEDEIEGHRLPTDADEFSHLTFGQYEGKKDWLNDFIWKGGKSDEGTTYGMRLVFHPVKQAIQLH